MKFSQSWSVISALHHRRSWLVCETDGFMLRGAVCVRQGGALRVESVARSNKRDLGDAVQEIVRVLREQGWKGGGRAVLLMPGVVMGRVELPVPPAKPRPPIQMQELVRWEVEPLLAQHTTLWTIGRILVGLGYLEETQAREILARQQGKYPGQEEKNALYSLKRFGDVAVEQGYITREQLEEALARQAWLRPEGEEIACGWRALEAAAPVADSYPWLVAGVNRDVLERWVAAFSAQHVQLECLMPVAGCAAALLAPDSPVIVLEVGGGQVVGLRLGEAGLENLVSHESALNGALEACLETYHALTPPDPETVWLAQAEHEAGLQEALSNLIGREVSALWSDIEDLKDHVSPGMAGVARQVLGLPTWTTGCWVPTRRLRPPVWQRPAYRLGTGVTLIIAALLTAEGILQVRRTLAEDVAARVNAQAAELDAAMARVQKLIDQQKAIEAKQAESKAIDAQIRFHEEELPRREILLRTLLELLERSVTDAVVLDRWAEESGHGVVVNAWALSDAAAQQFVLALKNEVSRLDLDVTDVQVKEVIGRLSLPGYGVSLRIVGQAHEATEKR